MEKPIYNQPLRISSILGVIFLFYGFALHGFETKRFDAPPLKRPTYLSFAKPASLRFSISPLPADRNNIALPAKKPIARNTAFPQVDADGNQTASFPIPSLPAGYDQNSSRVPTFQPSGQVPSLFLPQQVPSIHLPLSDPFDDLDSFGVDSTDELLQLLENPYMGVSGSSLQASPFVPPYTVAPDGLRISSRGTYKRIKR